MPVLVYKIMKEKQKFWTSVNSLSTAAVNTVTFFNPFVSGEKDFRVLDFG